MSLNAYAIDLAACLNEEITGLGPTDVAPCVTALRSFARRHVRRAAAAMAAVGFITVVAVVGVVDRNGDGKVDFADIIIGVRAVFAVALPARP